MNPSDIYDKRFMSNFYRSESRGSGRSLHFYMKDACLNAAVVLLSAIFCSACQPEELRISSDIGSTISGTAPAAFAASCADARVSLHEVLPAGGYDSTEVLSGRVSVDGAFSLDGARDKGVTFENSQVKYVLKTSGCGETYYRPLTEYMGQSVTAGSTLLSLGLEITDLAKRSMTEMSRQDVKSLSAVIDALGRTDLTDSLNGIIADSGLSQQFQGLTAISPQVLKSLPPSSLMLTAPPSLQEGTSTSYLVALKHWNTEYDPAYEWVVNGLVMSRSKDWTFVTTKDSQGLYEIIVRVGSRDGVDIDSSKPVRTETIQVNVQNTFPPVSPPMILVGASKVRVQAGAVQVLTGVGAEGCASVKGLALSENPLVPPLSPSAYSISCATEGSFSQPFTLSSTDGQKVLALWAIDSANNISSAASLVSVILDQTPPVLTLPSIAAAYKGGAEVNVAFTASDALSGLHSLSYEYAADGSSFGAPVAVVLPASSFAWTVPVDNRPSARLRLTATDEAGNQRVISSDAFVIDSIAPIVAITTPAQDTPGTGGVTVGGTCEAGLMVTLSGSGVASEETASCTAGSFSRSIVFAGTDGPKTVVASQTDAAGNVGSDQRQFVKDTMPPALAFTGPNEGESARSGLVIVGTCETGLAISISGAGVASNSTGSCTAGAFSEVVAFSAGDGSKTVTLSQTDAAGNMASVSRVFMRDSSAPSLVLSGPAADTSAQTGVTLIGTCEVPFPLVLGGSGIIDEGGTHACLTGSFSLPVAFTSGDGTKAIRIEQTDALSNTIQINRNFIRDTVAPTVTIQSPAAGTPAKSTLTVGGICEAGVAVVFSGSGLDGSATDPCSLGTFSREITFSAGDGTKNIVASQTDAAGNVGSSNRDFIRDNVAPVLTVTSHTEGQAVKAVVNLTGTCETGGSQVVVSSPSLASSLNANCTAGAFSISMTLLGADGAKTITLSQNDLALNTGSISLGLTLDTTPPTLTKTSPADGAQFKTGATLIGVCESGRNIEFTGSSGLTGTADHLCVGGGYSIPVTFTAGEGDKVVVLKQSDAAGNSTTLIFNLVRDETPPVLAIASPAVNTPAKTGVTVAGSCEAGITVAISGTGHSTPTSTTCTAGSFSVAVTFSGADGTKNIVFSQTDEAGNTGSVNRDFIKDTTPPALTITAPAANTSTQASVTLTGACETGLTISYGGSGIMSSFTGTACSGGAYSQEVFLQNDVDGVKTITVSQTDVAGNVATVSRDFVRDTTAPVITQTLRSFPYYANTNTVSFGGACQTGLNITAKRGVTTESSSVSCAAGSWNYTVSAQATDGAYDYSFEQTDGAGNVGSAAARFIRDTVLPSIAITGGAGQITASDSVTITGTCEAGLPGGIQVSNAATGMVVCSSGSWSYSTPAQTTDAVRTYVFTLTDQAGNSRAVSTTWERNTQVPNLLISTSGPIINTANSATVAGTCETGLDIEIRRDGVLETTITCSAGSFSRVLATQTTDGDRTYQFKQTNALSLSTTQSIHWVRDTVPPVLSANQFRLNSDAATTIKARVTVQMQAVDALTNVTHFCLKTDDMVAPEATAPCWISVASAAVGLTPSPTLSLTTYGFNLPIVPDTYTVYAWAKDAAGNISALSNSGAGTDLRDKEAIELIQASPPSVTKVLVGSTDYPANPPSTGDLTIGVGAPVFVKWKASDDQAFPAGAVSVFFSTDDSSWTLAGAGLNNGSNGSCQVNHPSTPADDDATGCFRMAALPASGYVKFRVVVKDASGIEAGMTSVALNVSDKIRFLAGNTDVGTGLSAQKAVFINQFTQSPVYPDDGSLVVARDGRLFFRDKARGILVVDPADGLQKIFLRQTGATSTGDGADVSLATSVAVIRIALDFHQPTQRLWVVEPNRIRRVDLATNVITSVVGGGTDTSDTVVNPLLARVDWAANSGSNFRTNFFVLPNGDLHFRDAGVGNHHVGSISGAAWVRYRERIFEASTGQLKSWKPMSITSTNSGHPSDLDFENCRLDDFGAVYGADSVLSERLIILVSDSGFFHGCSRPSPWLAAVVSFGSDGVGLSSHPVHPFGANGQIWEQMNFIQGLDLKLYVLGRNQGRVGLFRYNPAPDKTWTRIAGNGNQGSCADGVLATSCPMILSDAFVSEAGVVYLVDDGRIRTIKPDGTLLTLFGEGLSSGVGGPSLSARLGETIRYFERRSDGGIAFTDLARSKIFEFDPNGNLFHIAGDGRMGGADLSGTVDARSTPFNAENPNSSGDEFGLSPSGEIYHHTGTWSINKLVRNTTAIGSPGKWIDWTGYPADGVNVSHPDAEGSSKARYDIGCTVGYDSATMMTPQCGHLPQVMGVINGKVLVQSQQSAYYQAGGWTSTNHFISLRDETTKVQNLLLGKRGVYGAETVCSDGTLGTACEFFRPDNFRVLPPKYDSVSGKYLFSRYGWGHVFSVIHGGVKGTLLNVGDGMKAFTHRRVGGKEYIYFCSSTNSRLYRYDVSTSTKTALNWPIPAMFCMEAQMMWNPDPGGGLIFLYRLNGLMGVAEYFDASPP